MPARPHRTVDRVTAILETVSLAPQGVTLAELATALDAAKSSVQELTNGLLARGYLVEDDGRFHLGPGPFILAARTNKIAALSLDHRFVVELNRVLGCNVLVGVRVGDAIVFVDHVGQESPALTYVARTHARRPLYTSAAGKTLLANLPDEEMYRLLDLAGPERADDVRRFLAELARDTRHRTGVQPRDDLGGRVRRGHPPARTRRLGHRGDQRRGASHRKPIDSTSSAKTSSAPLRSSPGATTRTAPPGASDSSSGPPARTESPRGLWRLFGLAPSSSMTAGWPTSSNARTASTSSPTTASTRSPARSVGKWHPAGPTERRRARRRAALDE